MHFADSGSSSSAVPEVAGVAAPVASAAAVALAAVQEWPGPVALELGVLKTFCGGRCFAAAAAAVAGPETLVDS